MKYRALKGKIKYSLRDGDTTSIRAIPRAFFARIKELSENENSPQFEVFVTTAPEKGKANQSMLKFLSKKLDGSYKFYQSLETSNLDKNL